MTIPRKELVGKNAKSSDRVYFDSYMDELNKFASVDEVFGKHRTAIANGESCPVSNLVMDTLGKSEYENHLVALVMTAAKAGEWRAVLREPRKHTEGLKAVTEKHFGYVVEHEGQTFLLPSALYVVYCKQQLNF